MDTLSADTTLLTAHGTYSKRSGGDLVAPEATTAIATASQASSLLTAITRAASDQRVDMDKMERLFNMHQVIVAQEAKAQFNAAMARAQAKMVPVVNNAKNTHTQSSYAKLSAIHKAITPIYTEEGLALSFDTETVNAADPIPNGFIRTVAYVTHAGGHSERRHIDLPPDDAGSAGNKNKTRVQAAGSTNSYARRYLSLMIFNCSTEDDNDGNGADKGKKRDGDGNGQTKKETTGLPIYAQSKFDGNIDTWREMIAGGEKTADDIIVTISSKWQLSDQQKAKLREAPAPKVFTHEEVQAKLRAAKTRAELDAAADMTKHVCDPEHRKKLGALYDARINAVTK